MPYLVIDPLRSAKNKAIVRSSRVFSTSTDDIENEADTEPELEPDFKGIENDCSRPQSFTKRMSAHLRRVSLSSALSAVDTNISFRSSRASSIDEKSNLVDISMNSNDRLPYARNVSGRSATRKPVATHVVGSQVESLPAEVQPTTARTLLSAPSSTTIASPQPATTSSTAEAAETAPAAPQVLSMAEILADLDKGPTQQDDQRYINVSNVRSSYMHKVSLPEPAERKLRGRRSFLGISSPSLHSLRSFLGDDRPKSSSSSSNSSIRPPVIGQPVLVDNKAEPTRGSPSFISSPSLFSLHGIVSERQPDKSAVYKERITSELASRADKCAATLEEALEGAILLSITSSGAQLYIRGNSVLKVLSLDVVGAARVLHELDVAAALGGIAGFAVPHSLTAVGTKHCVLEMPYAGTNLRRWAVKASEGERQQVLWALARALADAERAAQFEHRNLHPGHVCVDASGQPRIIDVSLSRVNSGSGAPPLDDIRFSKTRTNVLPAMQAALRNDPSAFVPETNVWWLDHIARVLDLRRDRNTLRPARWTLKRGPRSACEALGLYNL